MHTEVDDSNTNTPTAQQSTTAMANSELQSTAPGQLRVIKRTAPL